MCDKELEKLKCEVEKLTIQNNDLIFRIKYLERLLQERQVEKPTMKNSIKLKRGPKGQILSNYNIGF